jgi:hypothetical protein
LFDVILPLYTLFCACIRTGEEYLGGTNTAGFYMTLFLNEKRMMWYDGMK